MPEAEKIIPRKLYMHFSGKIYVVLGFAIDVEDKQERVIISNCTPDVEEILVVKREGFFQIRPDGKRRFELVNATPQ